MEHKIESGRQATRVVASSLGQRAPALRQEQADDQVVDGSEVLGLVGIAHGVGLLVQAAFQLRSPGTRTAVIPIDTPGESPKTARRLANMGVDIVGMRFSGIFKSLEAGAIAAEELECLRGLVDEVHSASVVYAGVNTENLTAVARTGVKMVGVASAVDDLVYRALFEAIDNSFIH